VLAAWQSADADISAGVKTDGLGGYQSGDYAMDESGKDPGFAKAEA